MSTMFATIEAEQAELAAKQARDRAAASRVRALIKERKDTLQTFVDEFNELNYTFTCRPFGSTSYGVLKEQTEHPDARAFALWMDTNLYLFYNYAPPYREKLSVFAAKDANVGTAASALSFKSDYATCTEMQKLFDFFNKHVESGCCHLGCMPNTSLHVLTIMNDGRYKHAEEFRKIEPTFFAHEAATWITNVVSTRIKLLPSKKRK